MTFVPQSILYATVGLLVAGATAWADPIDIEFNRAVRPILSDRCYACHGPDAHSREADLRLDQRESALGTNEEGAAIVPGKPELSELVSRIHSDDPDVLMPPPKLNKPLTPASRVIREVSGDDAKRLEHAFRLVLSRSPKQDEKRTFLEYLARQREDLNKDTAGAKALASAAKEADATDVAVWTLACSVLLNLDETITRP